MNRQQRRSQAKLSGDFKRPPVKLVEKIVTMKSRNTRRRRLAIDRYVNGV